MTDETAATPILIRNADVYAPEHLGHRDLLLAGGRILWLAPHLDDLPVAAAGRTLELEGRRLIPGLIDGHVHITGGGGEAGFRSRVPPRGLSQFTRVGVTTAIGLLGTDDIARGTRNLLAAVYGLREEGLSAWAFCGGYHLPPATLTGSVRDDLGFVEALIGIGEIAVSDHRSSQPTFEELVKLAADARVARLLTGKAGILHLHMGDGPRGLELVRRALAETELPADVFQPTHVNRRRALFDEALALAGKGLPIDITAFPPAHDPEEVSGADAYVRALDAGIDPALVTVSSDAGGSLPCFDAAGTLMRMDVGDSGALLACLGELLARGVPLEQALAPFTSSPAARLHLARKGRIAAGADADLVALDDHGNPDLVIARGVVHVEHGRVARHGWFERPDLGG